MGTQAFYYDHLLDNLVYCASTRIVLFCNQSSFDFKKKKYLFDIQIDENKLERILIPEHGFFSAYQDQVNITSSEYKGVPCTLLYNKIDNNTLANESIFADADAVLLDIQDAGVRYYTYTSHIFAILTVLGAECPNLPIMIIDRPNPLGPKVEGMIINSKYTSILGHQGLIHRHGMSIMELCEWYKIKFGLIPYFSRYLSMLIFLVLYHHRQFCQHEIPYWFIPVNVFGKPQP